MTIRQLLADLSSAFHRFEDPKLEARHLLMEALMLDLNGLILNGDSEVDAASLAEVETWKQERLKGVPLAYLSGHKAFYKSDFFVQPGVLVPRPETEFVVEVALQRAGSSARIADLGCGSGCIGLSLLREIPDAKLVAVDSSKIAIEVTLQNARQLKLENRVEAVESSVEKWNSPQLFDLVVANPPYIAEGDERVQASVHAHEPHSALYSFDNGLENPFAAQRS